MKAYRIDENLGAVTEYIAVFADKSEAEQFIFDSRRDCFEIVEIDVPEHFWRQCFSESISEKSILS